MTIVTPLGPEHINRLYQRHQTGGLCPKGGVSVRRLRGKAMLKGYALSDTLEELQLMYPNSHDKIYFEWWTDYICENWYACRPGGWRE